MVTTVIVDYCLIVSFMGDDSYIAIKKKKKMRKKNSYHPIYLLGANVRTLLPISGVVQPVKFTAILTKTHFRYKIRIIHGTQEGYKFPEK